MGFRHTGKQKFHTMKKILALAFAAALLGFGCEKECGCVPPPQTNDFEYFIFGTAQGMCMGDCAKIFKLEGEKLFADDVVEHLINENVTFQTTSLTTDKVTLATVLRDQVPAELLSETKDRIGCPDCYDQGTIFIKIKTDGQERFWFIDPDHAQYAEFCKAVREAVGQMQ